MEGACGKILQCFFQDDVYHLENSSHFYFLVYHSSIEDVMFFWKNTFVRTYAWVCWRFIGQTFTNMTCLTLENSSCVAQAMGLILSFWRLRRHFWNDAGKLYVENRQLTWLLSILLSAYHCLESWHLLMIQDLMYPQKKINMQPEGLPCQQEKPFFRVYLKLWGWGTSHFHACNSCHFRRKIALR